MTNTQRITLRLSEVRSRLNEVSGLEGDAFTPEIRAEAEALTNEFQALEVRHRAAIVADGETETRAANDGEGREIRQLVGRASLGSYLASAARQVNVDGAEAELRAALNLDADQVPLDVLLPSETTASAEHRADAATNVAASIAESQSSIAGRIFAASTGDYLGIDRPTVPVGDSTYVALASGASADYRSAGATKDAEAATFTTKTVSPRRVTARYLFGVESSVKLAGLEEALRSDLTATLSDKLDAVALSGQVAVVNVSPAIEGLISQLTAPGDPSDVATASDYLTTYSGRVDGKYSADGANVNLLTSPDTFRHAYGLQVATSGDLLSEKLPAGRFRASANMPATASDIATAISYAAGPRRGFVQPVWRAATVIRDPYSGAASGQVALTVVVLTGSALVDAAPYSLHAFKLA